MGSVGNYRKWGLVGGSRPLGPWHLGYIRTCICFLITIMSCSSLPDAPGVIFPKKWGRTIIFSITALKVLQSRAPNPLLLLGHLTRLFCYCNIKLTQDVTEPRRESSHEWNRCTYQRDSRAISPMRGQSEKAEVCSLEEIPQQKLTRLTPAFQPPVACKPPSLQCFVIAAWTETEV